MSEDPWVAFVTARLDEDADYSENVHYDYCDAVNPELTGPCNCGYPARVLREVEAKRKILAGYDANGGQWIWALRALAAVYSDHPDYPGDSKAPRQSPG